MTAPLTVKKQDGGLLKISVNVLEKMFAYIQDTADKPEAGGLIIGRLISDSHDIVADEVTAPLPGDKRRRFNFWRKARPHQAALDTLWNNSNRTQTFLGEWHTHPEAIPTPSATDLATWKKKLTKDVYFTSSLVFIIVGTKELRVWEWVRGAQSAILIGSTETPDAKISE